MNFTPAEFETYQLKYGDILLNEGQSLEWVGRPAMYRDELPGACFQNTLVRFRSNPSVDPDFALLTFRHYLHSKRFQEIARWTVNIAHLGASRFAVMSFRLPPLAEQRRIVARIEELFAELDEAVAELERVRANLKRYRASVLKAAVSGDLTADWRAGRRDDDPASVLLERILRDRRAKWEADQLAKFAAADKPPPKNWQTKYAEPSPPDTSTLPTLPEGWCWVGMEQLLSGSICNGISVKGQDTPPGVPALRLSSMSDRGFDFEKRRYIPIADDVASELAVRENDFFLSRGNGSLHLVGRGTLAQSPPELIVFPDTMIRVRFPSVDVARFVATIWSSRFIRKQIEKRARTTAGIYKISQKDVEEFVVPLPPLAEQEAIVAEVEPRLVGRVGRGRDRVREPDPGGPAAAEHPPRCVRRPARPARPRRRAGVGAARPYPGREDEW